jgi:hypothetical protein
VNVAHLMLNADKINAGYFLSKMREIQSRRPMLFVNLRGSSSPPPAVMAAAFAATERWRVQERLRRLHDENSRLKFALSAARNTCQYALERVA